jgi:hypothetical protein
VRGTIGAAIRTLLFVGGMGLLFVGIFTYAFPPLGAAVMPAVGFEANPDPAAPGNGPSTLPSIVAIVGGLLIAGTALGVPGRSSLPLVPEQRYTRRQRAMVVLGGLFSVALPAALVVLLRLDQGYVVWTLPGIVLALVGGLLVLVGTLFGLS